MGNTCCTPGPEDAEANGTVSASAATSKETGMSKSGAAPKAKAQAAPAPARSAGGGLSFELVLQDLMQAEQLAYGTAWAGFGPGAESGSLTLDNQMLREFVATHSSISYDDLDTELLKLASTDPEMKVSQIAFIELMRDHAVQESKVLESFLSLSSNGDSIDSQECRSGLLMFKEELGPDSIGAGRWEQVFDNVMSDAGAVVSMEAWTGYCKKMARTAAIVKLAKL